MTVQFPRRAAAILWPSFLIAGALDAATFAVVDPDDLRWFGGAALDWSRQAVYSATFLIYWGFVSLSAALTVLLLSEDSDGVRSPVVTCDVTTGDLTPDA